MRRRAFLASAAGIFGGLPSRGHAAAPSFHSAIEVVGDGRWIWIDPPKSKSGLLEPREFDFKASIAIRGTGGSTQLTSATVLPAQYPEQKISNVQIFTEGCKARIRKLGPTVNQLYVAASSVAAGQVIRAVAQFRMTLYKQYHAFERENFPRQQKINRQALKHHIGWSPGIHIRSKLVRDLAEEVGGHFDHPWDKAEAFKKWVWKNIEMKVGRYTSVLRAIRNRKGDCEERASVFAAMCRVSGIPTRSVWVPNHVWAEFFLHDNQGRGYWIPAHTSGYRWFGFTGVHEVVLQKGDLVVEPERKRRSRFLHDWMKCAGTRPVTQYTSQLTPLSSTDGSDPGPGGRVKPAKGPWVPGRHRLDKYFRDGAEQENSPYKKKKLATASP